MNDCVNAEIRDALPDLVHGRLSELDRATLVAHVESCADCRAELELLSELRAAAPIAPAIDVARIAAAIPAYSPAGKSAVAFHRKRQLGWRLAAAVALLAIAGAAMSRLSRDEAGGNVRSAAVTRAVPQPNVRQPDVPQPDVQQVAALSLVAGVQELGDAELETLLSELDRIEPLPSAEPQPVTIGVDDIETDR